jgi:hypothetical protein
MYKPHGCQHALAADRFASLRSAPQVMRKPLHDKFREGRDAYRRRKDYPPNDYFRLKEE